MDHRRREGRRRNRGVTKQTPVRPWLWRASRHLSTIRMVSDSWRKACVRLECAERARVAWCRMSPSVPAVRTARRCSCRLTDLAVLQLRQSAGGSAELVLEELGADGQVLATSSPGSQCLEADAYRYVSLQHDDEAGNDTGAFCAGHVAARCRPGRVGSVTITVFSMVHPRRPASSGSLRTVPESLCPVRW